MNKQKVKKKMRRKQEKRVCKQETGRKNRRQEGKDEYMR